MDPDGLKSFGRAISRALGLGRREGEVTAEELRTIMDEVDDPEVMDAEQKEMISNIFELDEVNAGDIMTHRTDLVGLEENDPCRQAVRLSLANGISRLPVYRKSIDDVAGLLHVKDLLRLLEDPSLLDHPVREFMRPVMFVPESCPARELLIDFKVKHSQAAIVVDEYGGTAGLVTMEDILEEIVGNIQDEFDHEKELLTPCPGGYLADGSAGLDDLFDALGLEPPALQEDEEEVDSVSGLVADKLGRIPFEEEGAAVEWGGVRFEVLKADERKIEQLRCTRIAPGDAPREEQADGTL